MTNLQTERAATVALYLPQFHPIPENDGWYLPGFSEWHNVVRAQPHFAGHAQPHLPRDLGFYDLRVPEVLEQQARLARQHGIDAFCLHHYWFEGHRPLRLIVDRILDGDGPDFPFCLCWANENWSRHWDAGDGEVLLRQRYSPEDDDEHGRFLLRAMQHPRYLRVAGRPVLFIYRLHLLPAPEVTLARWREQWRAEGLGDVEIVAFETTGESDDPAHRGADSSAQFIPHGLNERVLRIHPADADPADAVFSYEAVAEHYVTRETAPAWRRHECVVPGWDNTPRRGAGKSFLLHGSSPDHYRRWLDAVSARAPSDGMVVINAWNEWAEGAYLEPDLRHGDAYLRATAQALGVAVAPDEPLAPGPEPVVMRDRFAELYLDTLEVHTKLRRRLSRLEATLQRQIDVARYEAYLELDEVRGHAALLAQENERLRRAAGASVAQ